MYPTCQKRLYQGVVACVCVCVCISVCVFVCVCVWYALLFLFDAFV
jgi:hypothetical protein